MVEPQPSKLMMRVRFPLPAPGRYHLGKVIGKLGLLVYVGADEGLNGLAG